MSEERARILLQATLELLNHCDDSTIIEDPMCMTVNYDGADCDGICLRDDIENWLEENKPVEPHFITDEQGLLRLNPNAK